MRTVYRVLFLSLALTGLACGLDSKPAAPSALKAAISANGAVYLSWADRSDNETGFVIERGPNNYQFAELYVTPPGTTRYEDYDVVPATTYFYRLRANNEEGLSLPSLVVRIDLPEAFEVPAAPSGLTATHLSGHDLRLSWTDNSSNETGFTIERGTIAIGRAETVIAPWAPIASVGANVKTFTDTDLVAGMTYSYRVAAVNVLGRSPFSDVATGSIPGEVTVPGAPADLTSEVGFNRVTLGWLDRSGNEEGFLIEHALIDGRWLLAGTTPPNVATISFAGPTAITGWYRVCAFNSAGSSAYANVATANHPPLTIPTAPSDLGVTATAEGIELTWHDNSLREQGFELERAFFPGVFTRIATLDMNVTRFSDSQHFPQHRWYRVRAFNAYGASAYSNVAELGGTPTLTVPAAPTALKATRQGLAIHLSWTDNATNELGFKVERNVANEGWVLIGTTPANDTTWNDNRPPRGPIFYRVYATNLGGDSAYSNVILVFGT